MIIDRYKRECHAIAAAALIEAFDWEASKEGVAFWSVIHQNLLDAADGVKVPEEVQRFVGLA